MVSRFSPHAVGTISKASYPLAKSTPSFHRSLEVKVSGDTAQVEITPVKAYKCDAPATWVDTSKQEVIQALRDMMLMRRMEIAADLMYKSQLIKGFCHLYDGQVDISCCVCFEFSGFRKTSVTSLLFSTVCDEFFKYRKLSRLVWRWDARRKTPSSPPTATTAGSSLAATMPSGCALWPIFVWLSIHSFSHRQSLVRLADSHRFDHVHPPRFSRS